MMFKIRRTSYLSASLILIFFMIGLSGVSGQDPFSNHQQDLIIDKSIPEPSIALSLSSFFNLFQSVNGSYEFHYNEMESLEFELGYIFKSILVEGVSGGIFKTTWKYSYKQKANNRYYIGLQQQFQADFIKGEAVYFANDFSHYRFDTFNRHKYRLSVLGLVGRDIPIFSWLHVSLNMNFGLQTLFVQVETPDFIDDAYEPVQLGSIFLLNDHVPVMPDGGVSVQLRFIL